MIPCEQKCGAEATVYAIDPVPGGWGGRYCTPCQEALRFQVVDRLEAKLPTIILYDEFDAATIETITKTHSVLRGQKLSPRRTIWQKIGHMLAVCGEHWHRNGMFM